MMFKPIYTILLGVALLAAFTNCLSMAQESEDELISAEQDSFEARENEDELISAEQDSFEARENEDELASAEQESFEARENDLDERAFDADEESDEDDSFKRAAGGAKGGQRAFQQEMLQSHNAYRKKHCAQPLQLDAALSRSARAYAQTLARKDKGLVHSKKPGVGENLSYRMRQPAFKSSKGLANSASTAWYNEIKKYKGETSPGTGHFTQLVWKNSKKLGVGYAWAKGKTKIYIVAQYSPQGNIRGQYKQNVAVKC